METINSDLTLYSANKAMNTNSARTGGMVSKTEKQCYDKCMELLKQGIPAVCIKATLEEREGQKAKKVIDAMTMPSEQNQNGITAGNMNVENCIAWMKAHRETMTYNALFIPTGKNSPVGCIDVDTHVEEFKELMEKWGILEYPVTKTRSGGLHVFFTQDRRLDNIATFEYGEILNGHNWVYEAPTHFADGSSFTSIIEINLEDLCVLPDECIEWIEMHPKKREQPKKTVTKMKGCKDDAEPQNEEVDMRRTMQLISCIDWRTNCPRIDAPYCSREAWVRIGNAIYNCAGPDAGKMIWKLFCMNMDNYDEKEIEVVWRSFHKTNDKKLGFGTLVEMERASNKQSNIIADLTIKDEAEDKITWCTFRSKWSGMSVDLAHLPLFLADFNQSIDILDFGKCVQIRRYQNLPNCMYDIVPLKMTNEIFSVEIPLLWKGQKSLTDVAKALGSKLKIYTKICFEPNRETPANVLNIFEGFVADGWNETLTQTDIEEITGRGSLEWHLRNVVGGNLEDECKEWLVQRIYHILQRPNDKVPSAIILQSDEHQIGKSIVGDWVGRYLIGLRHSTRIDTPNELISNFNGFCAERVFMLIDEASTSKDSNHIVFDKLKSLISAEMTNYENKFQNKGIDTNYTNFLICTNHERAIRIEKGDDRYFVCEVSPKMRGNREYFDKLTSNMKDETHNKKLMKYAKEYNLSLDLRSPPVTSRKRELQILTGSSLDRWISAELETRGSKETSKTLYMEYSFWCKESNERNVVTLTSFGREMKKVFESDAGLHKTVIYNLAAKKYPNPYFQSASDKNKEEDIHK